MKCVKDMDGKITRVSNERASYLVKEKKYSFCPKKEWKETGKNK